MMMFEVSGYLKALKRPFKKVVEAKGKEHAKHKVLSLFGSNNGIKRSQIVIEKIEEVKA